MSMKRKMEEIESVRESYEKNEDKVEKFSGLNDRLFYSSFFFVSF